MSKANGSKGRLKHPAKARFRELNNNWRGGKSIASNGYVLVRVGVGHHLADVRGYAYEHRVEAEKKIGRRLRPGELVHHRDENKKNNAHENLEVCIGNAGHFVKHRKSGKRLRMPGERNPMVNCACGCGIKFRRFDKVGRPRRFVSGHNQPPAWLEQRIIEALVGGPENRAMIALRATAKVGVVSTILSRMAGCGRVIRLPHGLWRLSKKAKHG